MAIIKLVITFILSFTQFMTPFFSFVFHGGIEANQENWIADIAFTREYCQEIEKTPGEDFVILTLADVQLNPKTVFADAGVYTYAMITKCIEETNPDLIVLVGDNSSSYVGYLDIIKFLDGFEIPWAPVMGNHDGGNGEVLHEAWDAYVLENSEYCLFRFGPAGMGYGNYIVNITENDKIVHSLFFMDSHSDAEATDAGKINYGKNEDGSDCIGYDHFWANQLEWYKWAVNGITATAGKTVESTVFMHIPVIEYRSAQLLCCEAQPYEDGSMHYVVKSEFADTGFGSIDEGICSPEGNNGFFALCKELGSTTHLVAGHDHKNDLSVVYDGIRLSYAVKSGHGSYYNQKQGGSVITIQDNGSYSYEHHYLEADSIEF